MSPPPIAVLPEVKELPDVAMHQRATVTQEEIVRLTNIERWNNGMLPPYKSEDLLHDAAQEHTEEMAFDDFFAHCNLDENTTPGQRITAEGYIWNAVSENIAAGSSTPAGAMGQWMGSTQGHREAILSSTYRAIGTGYAYDPSSSPRDRLDNGQCNPGQLCS